MSDVDNSSPHGNRQDNNRQLEAADLVAAARKLWGNPTKRGRVEWRFGARGSKSIRLDKLVWRDWEADEDGGIVELCRRAGINGSYHKPAAQPQPRKDSWQPLPPPGPAPLNMLTCDSLFLYRDKDSRVLHYVRRHEHPRRFLPLTYGSLNGSIGWHMKAPKPPLPLYGLDQLQDRELILLCEGEKAADAANTKIGAEQLNWLAMSWYGGAGRARHANVEILHSHKVIIWPDADEAGLKARDTLIEMLPSANALNVEGLPKGFDAADLGAEQSIREFVEARAKISQNQTVSDKPNAEPDKPQATLPPDISIDDFYAYLPKHWYLYVPTQTLWPPATIGARLGKIGTLKAARYLDRERAVSQMIWAPGEPQIVKDKHLIEGGWVDKPGAIVFNQYRAPKLEGGDPAQADPWINLAKFLWPAPAEHNHLIRTLAFKIQNPATKINHAIVLGGGMRIGKDTVLVPIKRILGEWNCIEAKPTTIMSNFNGYMRSLLLLINEARDLGETKRHEFYLHMKDVIATPPTTVLINEKHEKAIHAANVCLVIMTTNHRTDGIYLPPDDGRHFPVWSERSREEYEIDYFDRFYDWLNAGGDAHIAAYLHSLDVSDYRPGRPPPQTSLFHEIVQASTQLETTQIGDILSEWNPTVLALSSIISRADPELQEWIKKNPRSIPYRLAECGYTRIPNPAVADGRWVVGGIKQNIYGNKDLSAEMRLQMARELGEASAVKP